MLNPTLNKSAMLPLFLVLLLPCTWATTQSLTYEQLLSRAGALLERLSPLASELTSKTRFAVDTCGDKLPETRREGGAMMMHVQELIAGCGAAVVRGLIPIDVTNKLQKEILNQQAPLKRCAASNSAPLLDKFSAVQACLMTDENHLEHKLVISAVETFVSFARANIIETTIVAGPGKEKTPWKPAIKELFNRYELYARTLLPAALPMPGLVAFVALEPNTHLFQVCVGSGWLDGVSHDVCDAITNDKLRDDCNVLTPWNNEAIVDEFDRPCPTQKILEPLLQPGDVLLIDARTWFRRISTEKATFTKTFVRMDMNRDWPGWYDNDDQQHTSCGEADTRKECAVTHTWWFINKNVNGTREVALYRGSERLGVLPPGGFLRVEPASSVFTLRVDDVARKAWIFTANDLSPPSRFFYVDHSNLDTPIIQPYRNAQGFKENKPVLWNV